MFYPPDWLIYGIFPAHIGINIGNMFHLLLAGIGAYLWLRVGLGTERIASIVCGAAFPCSAWFWGQQEHINQVAAISWLPVQAFFTLAVYTEACLSLHYSYLSIQRCRHSRF